MQGWEKGAGGLMVHGGSPEVIVTRPRFYPTRYGHGDANVPHHTTASLNLF